MGPLEQLDMLAPHIGSVIAGIRDDQLDDATPCAQFTVRDVLGHMIGGATQFAAAFRNETAPPVPTEGDPRVLAGDALGDLIAAVHAPGALDRTVAAPFGEVPGEVFARFLVLDGLVHGWDLATATGQAYDPPEELVAAVREYAGQAIAPEMRDGDTFAAEVTPPAGATAIERLAAFTGRAV